MTMLSPENVLKKANEQLLECGGTPVEKKELENLIQEITLPIITKAEGKTPADFYNKNVTVRTPEYQIRGKVKAFAREILHKQGTSLSNFSKGEDVVALELIAEVICTTVSTLCADYFCQTHLEEERKTTQVDRHTEPSHH